IRRPEGQTRRLRQSSLVVRSRRRRRLGMGRNRRNPLLSRREEENRMGDWEYRFWGFEEDSEVLRVLRATRDGQVYYLGDHREDVLGLRSDIRSKGSRKFEQLFRDGSFQIEPPGGDPARWGSFADRRQHEAQFYRGARRYPHEREVQAQLRGSCERIVIHGHEPACEDFGCEIRDHSAFDRYPPDRCDHSPKSVQFPYVEDRFRAWCYREALLGGLSFAGEEPLQ